MNITKGITHSAIISLLYMSYRYINNTEKFLFSLLLTAIFIRRLYILEKSS